MSDDLSISLNDVEPLVREALTAAINRDPGRSADALAAMGDKVRECVLLATLINVYALDLTRTQGNDPTSQSLEVVANRFTTLEAWAEFDPQDVLTYVHFIARVASDRAPVTSDVATRLAFVMAAHLLSAYSSEPWYERLDIILNQLEAARP